MARPTHFGYNPPFIGGAQNVFSRQINERLVKNDLLQLLLTAPGERLMRPTFGSPVRPFLFEGMDDVNVQDLENAILTAISEFESRVTVKDIILNVNNDSNLLDIKLLCSLNIEPSKEFEVTAQVSLEGAQVGSRDII